MGKILLYTRWMAMKTKTKIKNNKKISYTNKNNKKQNDYLSVSLNKNASCHSLILKEFNLVIAKNTKVEADKNNKKLLEVLQKYKNWKIIDFS